VRGGAITNCLYHEGIYEIEDEMLRTSLMNAVQATTNKRLNICPLWEKNI
jgi:hypothetical protein